MTQSQTSVIASTGLLADVAESEMFDQPKSPSKIRSMRAELVKRGTRATTQSSWALLESIVVFDDILYDGYAFTRHKMSSALKSRIESIREHGLRSTLWPVEVYERVASKLSSFNAVLRDNDLTTVAREVPATSTKPYSEAGNDAFWDSADKNYHDDLSETKIARFSFAGSNQAFERAFFYAELANELGVGVLPRPSAGETFADTLCTSYAQCAHRLVQDKLKAFDTQMRPAELKILFPPLAQKIAWMSLREGRAAIDIAAELRESPNAKAYRQYVAELQAELRDTVQSADAPLLRKKGDAINRLQGDFDRLVSKWADDGAANEGVRYQTRNLRIQIIPAILSAATYFSTRDFKAAASAAGLSNVLLTAMFGNTIVVRDPILWGGEKYLSFVADWYDYQ